MILVAASLILTIGVQAKVRLSHLVGDNMIIQQNTEVRLWGWDDPGKTIKVSVSWSDEEYSVKAGRDGKWLVKVNSPEAGYAPLSITFDDGDKTTIGNILSGEVWLCSGQSNMQMYVRGFRNCPTDGYNDEVINASSYKGVHFCYLPDVASMEPLDDSDCEWKEIGPNTVIECSAVAYFFAQTLNRALDIPVGLVIACKGGSSVEAWLDKANLESLGVPVDEASMGEKWNEIAQSPMVWGNGTLHPTLNCTVKGILWYQGSSNVGDPQGQYSSRVKLLAEQWRRDFGLGEIPFYIVQSTPYLYSDEEGIGGALLREEQMRASKIIPNSSIVCTQDLVYPYESGQCHPAMKRPIGERLAFQALHREYGFENIFCYSPEFEKMEIKDGKCTLTFINTYYGFGRTDKVAGFEVAGEDRVFHKAAAYTVGTDQIVVHSDEVPDPVAVRYAFHDWDIECNVSNIGRLPLFPFRTDSW